VSLSASGYRFFDPRHAAFAVQPLNIRNLRMREFFVSCLAVIALAFSSSAAAAGKPPITLNVAYTGAPGGTSDQLLSSGALTSAVLSGLRESGVPVVLNAPEADVGVQLNLTALYSQQLDNLRVVSGTMSVRIPRPGAADFGDAYGSCERGFFLWGARTAQEVSVQRIKAGLTQEARNFAHQCRSELSTN
jgi:hypothetical protein